jgi:hypothetical protein
MLQTQTIKGKPVPVRFAVTHAGHTVNCTYQQVFASGYQQWLEKDYAEAAKTFEALTAIRDRGPRAHIMLSHCLAMLGDYSGCCGTLSRILPSETFDKTASDLHDAFVMWKCAFFVEAKKALENVVSTQRVLPTPCLILAELLLAAGNDVKSIRLLQVAMKRDRPDGAIATIAREKLNVVKSRLLNPPSRLPSVPR